MSSFLLDGDLSGRRVAQVSKSIVQAVASCHNQHQRVRDTVAEIEGPARIF